MYMENKPRSSYSFPFIVADLPVPSVSSIDIECDVVACSPALMTSGVASSEYFLKFSVKSPPSFVTSSLKSALPVHDFLGLSSSSGTPLHDFGTCRLKVSYVS